MASDTGNHSSPSPLGRLGSITLPRQMSIYSLTLDEFQSALGEPGKNFGSMNMDELLKNIWTAEESQAMAALFGDDQQQLQGGQQQQDQSSGPSPTLPRQNSVIQRQNSVTLLPLPQELSKKTVDEVWKNISIPSSNGGGAATAGGAAPSAAATGTSVQQTGRQTTYGEMTLEDFLVKAGVMTAETNPSPLPAIQGFPVASTMNQMAAAPKPILGGMTGMISKKEPIELNDPVLGIGLGASSSYSAAASSSNGYLTPAQAAARQQAEWMESQYKNSTALAQQQMLQLGYMNGGAVPGNGSTMAVMHGGLTGYSKEGSPGSPLSDAPGYGLSPNGTGYGFEGGLRGRKRILDAPLEKIVERRQRRMIKNRESAARSRARKQAYTVELEAEVNQLKEENMKLRKMQEEENMKKRKQLIGSMTQHLPKGLRRTLTGPW